MQNRARVKAMLPYVCISLDGIIFTDIKWSCYIKERQKQEEPRCELANITAQGSVCGFDYLCLIYLKENTATKVFHLSSPYIS